MTGGAILAWALFLLAIVALTLVASTTLGWMLYSWRSPDQLVQTRFPTRRAPAHYFSLLVPAYNEESVLGRTLERLLTQTHDKFEIICIVRDDDPATAAVADQVAATDRHRIKVLRGDYWPQNKPAAMNMALPHCEGDVIGVFDAEDDVHADLLANVDSLMQASNADVVQAGVQLMNFWSSWFSVRSVLEYYFWFRSRLHFHAAAGFIPLGGNTVFIRADVLRNADGWDQHCLAEDCEVGVRLSSSGHRVAVAYDPALVTREETPDSISALIRQRTRWNQGFLQVLRKGEWRRLRQPRQRALALYTLAMPFLQAFTGCLLPLAIAGVLFLRMPVVLAMASFVPLIPTVITVAIEVAGLREFGQVFELKVRARDYARLVVGAPFYGVLLAVAAGRAIWRESTGRRGWEKSSHANLHRADMAPAAE